MENLGQAALSGLIAAIIVLVVLAIVYKMMHKGCSCGGARGGQPIPGMQTQAAQQGSAANIASVLSGFDLAI